MKSSENGNWRQKLFNFLFLRYHSEHMYVYTSVSTTLRVKGVLLSLK